MAQASMQQSAQIAATNMANLRQQQRMAANAPTQDPLQPASPPQTANPDTVTAAANQKRQMLKRFGFNATVSNPLGGSSTLGGAS